MAKFKIQTREIEGETWFKFDRNFDKVRYYHGNILTIILIVVLVVLSLGFFYVVLNYVGLITTNPCQLCEKLGYTCMNIQVP